jgi:hypothetical protein
MFLAALAAGPCAATYKPTRSDDDFLEDLSRRAFRFFWEQGDPNTGLVLDRVRADGTSIPGRNLEAASTAVTGFYLTALCIAHARRWMNPNDVLVRVRACLRHLANDQEHVRGWYYHFVNRKSGERIWSSELSSIDTALLVAGVITAQQYFQDDGEIYSLGAEIYSRIDFPWLADSRTGLIRMGWFPDRGFIRAEWGDLNENLILNFLAIASPTYPLSARSWYLFERPSVELAGYRFVGRGPLFTHQYSQTWLQLSGLRDGPPFGIDYFQNSVLATYAFRALWLSLRSMYPDFSEKMWGVSPSDSNIGYIIWGSPDSRRDLDGTVVPYAAAGSLMFAPEICLPPLRYMHDSFADRIYGRYGFVDSFNPITGWSNPDVVGIDVGITLMSAENLRTGNIWRWFNRSPDVQRGMRYIFEPTPTGQ